MVKAKLARVGRNTGLTALLLLSFAKRASASDEDAAAAQRLFDHGRALIAAGRWEEACDKLAASEKLSHAGGTVLNLAECHAHVGRTASAWSRYREAAGLAKSAGRADVEELATRRADELFAELPYLSVMLEGMDAASAEVRRDGTSIPREAWGIEVPVDPGAHVVEIARPGFRTFRWSGTLAPREHARVRPVWVAEERIERSSAVPIIGWSLVGAGGVAFVLTGVLAGAASAQYGDAARVCPNPDRCADLDATLHARGAKGTADAATATLVVGSVLAAVGLGVVLFWPRGSPNAALRVDARGVTFEVAR